MQNTLFTIDCGEILLREYTLDDVDALTGLLNQPEIYEFIPGAKATKEQRLYWAEHFEIPATKRFLQAVPDINGQGWLNLGIILKGTGEFIGICNSGIKDELPEPNREIGYAISRDHRNKGYSTLAAKGLINYLFTHTNLEFLNAVAVIHNLPSHKVLEKCGFREEKGTVEIDGENHKHFTLSKKDWVLLKQEG